MHYEVEQKFPLADSAAVLGQLAALGAKAAGQCEQVDCYFNHPSRDFAQTDEALRIRQVDGRSLITYKGPKIDQETKTRHEIELPLATGATAGDDFAQLLLALGFVSVAKVHKHRRTLDLDWQGHEVEVALDDVTGVGHFVELEISATAATLDAARRALVDLAAHLKLGASERRSYLELQLAGR
jgi:adenylate cyclase, class 2